MQQNHANGWAKAWQYRFCFLLGKLVSAYFKRRGSPSAAASLRQYKTVRDKQEVSSHLETRALGSRDIYAFVSDFGTFLPAAQCKHAAVERVVASTELCEFDDNK